MNSRIWAPCVFDLMRTNKINRCFPWAHVWTNHRQNLAKTTRIKNLHCSKKKNRNPRNDSTTTMAKSQKTTAWLNHTQWIGWAGGPKNNCYHFRTGIKNPTENQKLPSVHQSASYQRQNLRTLPTDWITHNKLGGRGVPRTTDIIFAQESKTKPNQIHPLKINIAWIQESERLAFST
jgi:hypothetical protein